MFDIFCFSKQTKKMTLCQIQKEINKFLEMTVVHNCDNGLTIPPPRSLFFDRVTPESDSAKNIQRKI